MPAVARKEFFRDSPVFLLNGRVPLHLNTVFPEIDTQFAERPHDGFGRSTGVGFSGLVTFPHGGVVATEQAREGFGGKFHHGLKTNNLFGHVGGDHC